MASLLTIPLAFHQRSSGSKVRRLIGVIAILMAVTALIDGFAQEKQPGIAQVGAAAVPGAVIRDVCRSGVTSSMLDFEDPAGWRMLPDMTDTLEDMAFEEDSPGTAITKLTSSFEPPATGDYDFWISSKGSAKIVVSQKDAVAPMDKAG